MRNQIKEDAADTPMEVSDETSQKFKEKGVGE
jgi:hypothetical protein